MKRRSRSWPENTGPAKSEYLPSQSPLDSVPKTRDPARERRSVDTAGPPTDLSHLFTAPDSTLVHKNPKETTPTPPQPSCMLLKTKAKEGCSVTEPRKKAREDVSVIHQHTLSLWACMHPSIHPGTHLSGL